MVRTDIAELCGSLANGSGCVSVVDSSWKPSVTERGDVAASDVKARPSWWKTDVSLMCLNQSLLLLLKCVFWTWKHFYELKWSNKWCYGVSMWLSLISSPWGAINVWNHNQPKKRGGLRLSAFLSSFGAVFVDLCLPRCVCSEQCPGSGVLLFPLVFKARLTEEAACSVQGQQWPSCLGGHCGFVYLLRPD